MAGVAHVPRSPSVSLTEKSDISVKVTESGISDRSRRSYLISGFSVMAKSLMGSGILGLAYTCGAAGWAASVILLIVSAVATCYSLHFLAMMAMEFSDSQGKINFFALATKLSPKVSWLVDLAIAVKAFGVSICYIQVTGGLVTLVICQAFEIADKSALSEWIKVAIKCCMIAFLAPWSFCKEITSTQVANLVGIGCLFYVVVVAMIFAQPDAGATMVWPESATGLFARLPVFIFAFSCHQNFFPVAEETPVHMRRVASFDLVCFLAVLVGLVIYFPTMLLPYFTFGSDIKDNFLTNLPKENLAVQVAYVAAALSVSISYPLQIHPLRRSVIALATKGRGLTLDMEFKARMIITGTAVVSTLLIAIFVDSLALTMQLTGLIGGNTVAFVLPCWLFIQSGLGSRTSRIAAWVIFVFMCALYPVALFSIIYQRRMS